MAVMGAMAVAQNSHYRPMGGIQPVQSTPQPLAKNTFEYHFNAMGDFIKNKGQHVTMVKNYRVAFTCRASNDNSAKKKWQSWYNKNVLS